MRYVYVYLGISTQHLWEYLRIFIAIKDVT